MGGYSALDNNDVRGVSEEWGVRVQVCKCEERAAVTESHGGDAWRVWVGREHREGTVSQLTRHVVEAVLGPKAILQQPAWLSVGDERLPPRHPAFLLRPCDTLTLHLPSIPSAAPYLSVKSLPTSMHATDRMSATASMSSSHSSSYPRKQAVMASAFSNMPPPASYVDMKNTPSETQKRGLDDIYQANDSSQASSLAAGSSLDYEASLAAASPAKRKRMRRRRRRTAANGLSSEQGESEEHSARQDEDDTDAPYCQNPTFPSTPTSSPSPMLSSTPAPTLAPTPATTLISTPSPRIPSTPASINASPPPTLELTSARTIVPASTEAPIPTLVEP